jgi:hypothetical protein
MRLVVSRPIIPSNSVLETEEERALYRARYHSLCGKRGIQNPRSLSRVALKSLDDAEYVVALKTDGVRYSLFLTFRPNTTSPVALMIDRAWHMYEVDVVAPEEHFSLGTVLEGELVWQQPNERSLLFLVFDCVVLRGKNLTGFSFEERLMEATRVTRFSDEISTASDLEQRALETDSVVLVHYHPPLSMRPKNFIARKHAAQLWAQREDVDHRVDGIILQQRDAVYYQPVIFKWKQYSTVDLVCRDAQLETSDGPLHGVSIENSRIAVSPGDITEYLVTVEGDKVSLMALRSRPDKLVANSAFVVAATIQDVRDNISVEELGGN